MLLSQFRDVVVESTARTSGFDRSVDDLGNIVQLEHLNLRVPDLATAELFYVRGLGLTRDPYMDFGPYDVHWINVGEQQLHLPRGKPQCLRGRIQLVVPGLDELQRRLELVAPRLADTAFRFKPGPRHITVTCPWGNRFQIYDDIHAVHADLNINAPIEKADPMRLGIPALVLDVAPNTAQRIGAFYQAIFETPVHPAAAGINVRLGHNQHLCFRETGDDIPAYDGYHIAVYVANFSRPHARLIARSLITEESDAHQYRFHALVDPESGAPLSELEHEVRSLAHPMYRRPLVNRDPANHLFAYRRGREQFTPP